MLKTSPMTKISAAVAIPFIAGTVALFWLASLMHIDPHLAPAGPTVERHYAGNADLYQMKATCNGTMPPWFVTEVVSGDRHEMRRHIRNTAARRHWIRVEYSGYHGDKAYLVPDYDIGIIREMTRTPYEWAQQPEQRGAEYAPRPDPEDMMRVVIGIRTYQPSTTFLAGAIVPAIIATVMTLATAGLLITDVADHRRQARRRETSAGIGI